MRRLFLLRHAKAEHARVGQTDRERPLALRGHRQMVAMSGFFKVHGFDPGCILCSSAVRTRETLGGLKGALTYFSSAEYCDELYDASIADIVTLLEERVTEAGDVLVVGHNPGIEQMAHLMASSSREHERQAALALAVGYPTCTLTIFETDRMQADAFSRSVWRLVGYFRPEE